MSVCEDKATYILEAEGGKAKPTTSNFIQNRYENAINI